MEDADETTGAILRAHPSNFRQLGFVQEVEIEELCELGVPVVDDIGSGVLAGGIYAYFVGYLAPGSFPVLLSIEYVVMAVVGSSPTVARSPGGR